MIVFKPHEGFQEKFVSSNVDIVIGGGILASGKSMASVLMQAEPLLDGNYRALMIRKNLTNLSAGGGLIDEVENVFGCIASVRKTGTPCAVLPSGARIDFTHVSDEDKDTVVERSKGWQYDCIYFDELTAFDWQTFATIITRNRGTGKWTGKIRATCNPKRSHWLRTYLDWYIGADGYIREDRDGVVRYVYAQGEGVDGLVFGSSKEEVYQLCKLEIDRRLLILNKGVTRQEDLATYEDLILSTVFYKGNITENKATLGRDKGYLGKVAMMGGRLSEANLDGNWNVDPDEDTDAAIPLEDARAVFENDPMVNQERWITADIADYGDDNLVILVWYGLHVVDKLVLCKTTPKQNIENILMMATKHQIGNPHIIYDATSARYIESAIQGAQPYISSASPRGLYGRMAARLKDECYLRLQYLIKHGMITMDDELGRSNYPHVKPNGKIENILTKVEFIEECKVVNFLRMPNGKQRLENKKGMNKQLGHSMDLLDPFAMRMLPLLKFEYGQEFEESTKQYYHKQESAKEGEPTIYDILED